MPFVSMMVAAALLVSDPIDIVNKDCLESGSACSADCHNLLADRAFGPLDCSRVFDLTDDPLSEAAKIKCGGADNIDFGYWTDDEFVIECGQRR